MSRNLTWLALSDFLEEFVATAEIKHESNLFCAEIYFSARALPYVTRARAATPEVAISHALAAARAIVTSINANNK